MTASCPGVKMSTLAGILVTLSVCLPRFAHGAEELLPWQRAIEHPNADQVKPLVPPATDWSFNEYWQTRAIGPRDFYMAGQGPYLWLKDEAIDKLRQVGLLDRLIPGHTNFSYIKYYLPEEREKLAEDSGMRRMIESMLENGWPIHTIFYHRFQGNPPPSEELLAIIGEQWIGDGQPETVYRLEPVFHYLKTGERWVGSSMHLWKPEVAVEFFANDLMPRLEKELPFIRDLEHEWTRPELRRLSDLYCEEFYRPIGRTVAWGMYVGSYHLASLPETVCVAEKGADAFAAARLRGMNRQFGGGKFQFVWRGHEPTEMWAYFDRAWFTTRGDEWGMPLPHIWYYLYRPYLIGASYYVNEGIPASCMQDIEGDGQMELSTLGYILKDMLDFVDRHPERGVAVAPIALMLDYNRSFPGRGVTYFGYNLPNDDADFFNEGLFQTLFPEHRHAEGVGGYSRTAPLGEIFDILQPNVPGSGADEKALANYEVLLALGGMSFDEDFSAKVIAHVREGGTLVLCAPDVTPHLPSDFLGLELTGESVAGGDVICTLDDQLTQEQPYQLRMATLTTAEAVCKDSEDRPVVTRNRFGEGHVVVLLADYAVEQEAREVKNWRGIRYQSKPLLKFVPHFLEHLAAGTTPIEVRCRPESRPDLSWSVARKGDGWVVAMYNYSCAREQIVPRRYGTACVHATHPLKELPFQIVCRTPVADVVEWHGDRDVNWALVDGKAVISETMHGGEIRVYELQPQEIDLGTRTRYVNYALNQPVKASSSLANYPPENAVDGNLGRDNYWWSDSDPKRHYRFEMPQWLEVDLGEVRAIDHIFILLHWWGHESLLTRLRVYKYIVEASADGEQWQTVIDESRNEDNARPEGTERWFEQVEARYVRLTVLRNSAFGGARVVELKVMGEETEEYQARRQSIIPDWEVQYPPSVRGVPESQLTYLLDLEPVSATVGWLPAGKSWEGLSGSVKLVTNTAGDGRDYPKSVYAQAASEFVYPLDGQYRTFVAAAGIGTTKPNCSVEFIIYVDGQEHYKSPLYRLGQPVLPVVVEVAGASELKLVVTDGGDGITNDYAWWGEARLIKK